MIVEDFRTGAAGASVAHRPEIVGCADSDDPVLGQTGDFPPEAKRFIIVCVDGDEQLFLGQAEFLMDQRPGVLDRFGLEVVAEGKVSEHLEEGMVPCGVAHVVEIVMFAASANALL